MILRRLAVSVVMLTAVSALIFVVLRLLPGDPVITRLGATPGISPATIAQLRKDAGLDDPIVVQYLSWMGGVLHGDFGRSYFNQYSVTQLIGQRLPTTIELTILSMIIAVVLAVPAALLTARRPGGVLDRALTTLSSAGMALPNFIVGVLLIVIFAVKWSVLPSRGFIPIGESLGGNLRSMLLPSLTLAIAAAPLLLRFLRASLLEVLTAPFLRTARGKGASDARVLLLHAFRNALIPAVTMLGLIVGYTLGGAVIIEYIFGLPGLGSLAVDSVTKRDYAVLQSCVLLISAMFILTTLVVDIVTGILDPRLRTGRGRG
jgi:peptide/nickel transport system permease protein